MPKHFEALLSQYLKRFYYINHPSFNDKKMRECLDKGNKFEAMLTDISKPFVLTKLHTNTLDMLSLKPLHIYLTKR